ERLHAPGFAIAAALARAGRTAEIPAALASVAGLGEDRTVVARARAALAPDADAGAALALAAWFRRGPGKSGDDDAALAVAAAGLERHPGDVRLHALAGASALDLDRPLVAISSFEAAVAGDIRTAGAASALAGLYESRIA